jgi:hypothetical protein
MNAIAREGRATIDRVRELVADVRFRVQLDDVVAEITSGALDELRHDRFSTRERTYDAVVVEQRLEAFEPVIDDALAAAVLIARWGDDVNMPTLQRMLREFGDYASGNDGIIPWQVVRWTPFFLVLYASGVAALLGNRPEVLAALYTTRRGNRDRSHDAPTIVQHAIDSVRHGWADTFKQLPAYERQFVAPSNYIFDRLRPTLDAVIHAGSAYEEAFDRFEILHALTYASAQDKHGFWGPPGRFAVQYRNGGGHAFKELESEAEAQQTAWPITTAGMFGGNTDTFLTAAKQYREFMNHLGWH